MADRLFLGSGLDVTILRPSLVYGPGARGVFVKLAGLVRRLPVIPVIGPGTWHLRPVFLDDLIDLVVATLARPDLAGRTYDVGGPDLVTYNEFLAAICRALGRRCRRGRAPVSERLVLPAVAVRARPETPPPLAHHPPRALPGPCRPAARLRRHPRAP